MQVILDASFARPGSVPIGGGKKGEFRDWTIRTHAHKSVLRWRLFISSFLLRVQRSNKTKRNQRAGNSLDQDNARILFPRLSHLCRSFRQGMSP